MPRGKGYWYDRQKRRYRKIDEHATDAVATPALFRAGPVAHLNPVKDREAIVRHVASQGFIRIRHWDRLGFEFHGDKETALRVLKRYIKREEIGPYFLVHLADFATGWVWEGPVRSIPWQNESQAIGFR